VLLKRSELLALTNYLYEKRPTFEIKTALIGSLFNVDLERNRVRILLKEREYDDIAFEYEGLLPDSSNYKTALVAAGVLTPENQAEVFKEIREEFGKTIYQRPRPLYASFDTNAFVNRTTFHLQNAVEKGAFVVAEGVRHELFREKERCYTEYEIRELRMKSKGFEEFLNQPKVVERIFRMGRAEYSRFRSSTVLEEIPSEAGDNEIAEALRRFARERNCDVWIITFDKNMYDIAAGFGLKPLLLDIPKVEGQVEADWEKIADLIYTTSLVFGYVTISGIEIFGVWRGKSPSDWSREAVKVKIKDEEFKREVEVLRELERIVRRPAR